jgi:hypothetical protein
MAAEFAYRIHISYGYLYCRVNALLIALVTVSFQAIKAAIANPVEEFENGVGKLIVDKLNS